ncbi:MAG: YraN family protein [Spirochaetota bacterium]
MAKKGISSSREPWTRKSSAGPEKAPRAQRAPDGATSTHRRGAQGEERAAEYLVDLHYTILERNFRTRTGEVDIIAVEGGTIAFCEVKSWERMPIAGLEYALSRRKQGRIIRTSLWYLHTHPCLSRLQPRYDVLFVSSEGVEHLMNAFSERGAW